MMTPQVVNEIIDAKILPLHNQIAALRALVRAYHRVMVETLNVDKRVILESIVESEGVLDLKPVQKEIIKDILK
jgi:hypothetical protein